MARQNRTDPARTTVLVKATRANLTPDRARARVLPLLDAVIAETCRWGRIDRDWDVGDYRFLVLEFSPEEGAAVYVQMWTEPDENVLLEACSGVCSPRVRKYVQEPQQAALRARGFEIGGRASNFQKRLPAVHARGLRALAREVAAVLVDVYGYRCRQPLVMHYCASGRSEPAAVFNSLVERDVKRMLAVAGFHAIAIDDDGRPVPPEGPRPAMPLLAVMHPFRFIVQLSLARKDNPLAYSVVRLMALLGPPDAATDADIVEMNNLMPCGRIERDGVGALIYVLELWLYGITVEWFVTMMMSWRDQRAAAMTLVKRARRARRGDVSRDLEIADEELAAIDAMALSAPRPRSVVH